MHEETVIVKEELDIDDTKIKLELDEDEDANENENATALNFACAGGLMQIIEERPNMITVPVHDVKSEDELKFIASLGTLDQQQKLFVTSSDEDNENACKICSLQCENHLALASHQINHQLNRHFCTVGCGYWCDTLEEIQEHEYRQHAGGRNNASCRICQLELHNVVNLTCHMSTHYYVRRFACALCRRHFDSSKGLQLHRRHSKEICGRLEYVDTPDQAGQLVAVSGLNSQLPAELLCGVQIKAEPQDEDEEMQAKSNESQLPMELTEAAIKTEPKEEPRITLSMDSANLAGTLRAKLRLPAIKKPVKHETLAKVEPHVNSKAQCVPVNKRNADLGKRPNILKPTKAKNQQDRTTQEPIKKALQISKITPNVAANNNNINSNSNNNNNNNSNILKMLPNNCMLIKLPPNTKIIKIQPTTSSINTNSCTIGSKIIALPKAMSIGQQSAAPTPLVQAPPAAQVSPPQDRPINRNAYFNDLSLFESLPESRKIITEFQNQIRSIEQSLPLPGSVLHTKKSATPGVLPTQLEVLRLPLTKGSNIKVRELRYIYPKHRFHWQCPQCARCYEQYFAFCNHLTTTHSISQSEFAYMEVQVKTYQKYSIPANSEAAELPPEPEPVTTSSPAAPAAEAPATTAVSAPPAAAATAAKAGATSKEDKPAKSGRSSATLRPQQYQCEECSKCFTTVGAVRIHKMIHTGELPHKCSYCEKRFRTPGQVRVHQRRHTGEKPFKCKVCSLDFTHRETLISHLSRHIGMKRYKCYGCDKNFVVVSGLRAHRRLRPDTCGKVKFTARAHGPRVRVIRGEVVFESHPEHNGYLRSEDPLKILSEMNDANKESDSPAEAIS
ncbi:hypothetical protein KR222_000077 [Zaprionus bogoriensis]|nr:hypothetical protein KR222_000077 [Zaprionus bogoriensis]